MRNITTRQITDALDVVLIRTEQPISQSLRILAWAALAKHFQGKTIDQVAISKIAKETVSTQHTLPFPNPRNHSEEIANIQKWEQLGCPNIDLALNLRERAGFYSTQPAHPGAAFEQKKQSSAHLIQFRGR